MIFYRTSHFALALSVKPGNISGVLAWINTCPVCVRMVSAAFFAICPAFLGEIEEAAIFRLSLLEKHSLAVSE